jgi:hypothetical protein
MREYAMITASTQRTAISAIRKAGARLWSWRRHAGSLRAASVKTIYQVTDLLHREHTVRVPEDEIAATVSTWLAELDAHSPLATDLGQAVRAGDWPTVHAIGERLSVDVAVAA